MTESTPEKHKVSAEAAAILVRNRMREMNYEYQIGRAHV